MINAAASGNGEAAAARAYASRLASYIDVIAKLAVNPNSVRNTVSNCHIYKLLLDLKRE